MTIFILTNFSKGIFLLTCSLVRKTDDINKRNHGVSLRRFKIKMFSIYIYRMLPNTLMFPVPVAGRRCRAQPLQFSAPRDTKTRRRPHSAQNPSAIPVQTSLSDTGIYTIPTASNRTHRKYRSENSREPLIHTRGGQGTPAPPRGYIT